MMRFRNEGFKTSGKDNRYGILQKNLKLNLEETAMKSLFEQMGGTYTLQGDYYLPNVTLPAEGNKTIGIWGQRHLRYIRQHRKVFYTNLLTSGRLNGYLADIDRQATELFFRLMEQMAEHEGITEELKAEHPMEWIGRMNALRESAVEIVNAEVIFA